jgi:hypothetical protein
VPKLNMSEAELEKHHNEVLRQVKEMIEASSSIEELWDRTFAPYKAGREPWNSVAETEIRNLDQRI